MNRIVRDALQRGVDNGYQWDQQTDDEVAQDLNRYEAECNFIDHEQLVIGVQVARG